MKLSIWLTPCDKDITRFKDVISQLASSHKTKPFEPHVTLFSGDMDPRKTIVILSSLFEKNQICTLLPKEIKCEEEFTKSLFLVFSESKLLDSIANSIQNSIPASPQYSFDPHLSLLYIQTTFEKKKKICSNLNLSFNECRFDRLKIIHIPTPVRSPEDISLWKEKFSIQL